MNRKRIIFIILLIMVVVLVLICILERGRNDAKRVLFLPSSFISLDEAMTSSEGDLRRVFWETQISFMNANDTCIYQTSVKNDSFIVKYKGKYYINETKYNELIETVTKDEVR